MQSDNLEEKLGGLDGQKKTKALVAEMKKNYKLNMLMSYIDQEAINVRGGAQANIPLQHRDTNLTINKSSTKLSEGLNAN